MQRIETAESGLVGGGSLRINQRRPRRAGLDSYFPPSIVAGAIEFAVCRCPCNGARGPRSAACAVAGTRRSTRSLQFLVSGARSAQRRARGVVCRLARRGIEGPARPTARSRSDPGVVMAPSSPKGHHDSGAKLSSKYPPPVLVEGPADPFLAQSPQPTARIIRPH